MVKAVDGVSFELERGKVLGIVGESGSGKSVTSQTILGLTRGPNTRFSGEVRYKGQNLLELSEEGLQDIRGAEIAMIFQDPMTSLNPVYRVGDQIVEMIRTHEKLVQEAGARPAPSTCSPRSGSRTRGRAWTTTRTSSRAACASAR